MLFFISVLRMEFENTLYLNTSHVILYRGWPRQFREKSHNLNTSHVILYQMLRLSEV